MGGRDDAAHRSPGTPARPLPFPEPRPTVPPSRRGPFRVPVAPHPSARRNTDQRDHRHPEGLRGMGPPVRDAVRGAADAPSGRRAPVLHRCSMAATGERQSKGAEGSCPAPGGEAEHLPQATEVDRLASPVREFSHGRMLRRWAERKPFLASWPTGGRPAQALPENNHVVPVGESAARPGRIRGIRSAPRSGPPRGPPVPGRCR